jgi:NTP pyrophosphatase (non-canonical NTP hydrolase)
MLVSNHPGDKMTPNEFVPNAIRTESRVESIIANERILKQTINGIVALSEILDQIKKNAFYGKPFDVSKLHTAIRDAKYAVEDIENKTMQKYASFPMPHTQRKLDVNPRLFHAIIGVATESAELLEALNLESNDFDRINILEEFGDLNWYQAIAVDELNANLETDVLDRVIAKLRARYPEKFTSENAINRDLVKERNVLEGKE